MNSFAKNYCFFSFVIFLFLISPELRAGIIIDATFDSTIVSDPNAAQIELGIDDAIAVLEHDIENPITVEITFSQITYGLGESYASDTTIPYSQYLYDLQNDQTLSANDNTAIASLLNAGSTNNDPVVGKTGITINTALYKAFGGSLPGSDGNVDLNFSIMNLSRTGPQNTNDYDLQAIATHEMDEVLGIGGTGTSLPDTSDNIAPLDLFRYSSNGVRSFTADTDAKSYFSIDGGKTMLVGFNQTGRGSDYGDWAASATPQVQDAYGTPGVDINLGTNELTALDVIGYNLATVPEPSEFLLLGIGLLAVVAGASLPKNSLRKR